MIWIRKRVRSNECGVILPQFLKLEIMILLRGKSKTTHKEGSSYIMLRASYMEGCSPTFMKWFSRHRTFVNEGVRTFSVRILWTVTCLCKWYNWLNFLPSSLPLPWARGGGRGGAASLYCTWHATKFGDISLIKIGKQLNFFTIKVLRCTCMKGILYELDTPKPCYFSVNACHLKEK